VTRPEKPFLTKGAEVVLRWSFLGMLVLLAVAFLLVVVPRLF